MSPVLLGLAVIVVGLWVALFGLGFGRDHAGDEPEAERERAAAAVLLHAARRDRQLAQLESQMERQTEAQLDRWERGEWGGGW